MNALERVYPVGHSSPEEAIRLAYAQADPEKETQIVLLADNLSGMNLSSYEDLSTLIKVGEENGKLVQCDRP